MTPNTNQLMKMECSLCTSDVIRIGSIHTECAFCGSVDSQTLKEIGSPSFTHDCEHCNFLGTYRDNDLYYCGTEQYATVVARRGNEVGDYTSGLIFDGIDPLITEGARRARSMGFLQ